jgi:3-hydroxybutyryl-CoA dehydrogenase
MGMKNKNIGIIGAGVMGRGIAQASAVSGYSVVLQDIDDRALAAARETVEKSLAKLESKGRIDSGVREAALERIVYTGELDGACENAGLIIEAIFEDLTLKHKLFRELERRAPMGAILASNTSALPITEIASVTSCGSRIIGLHFMNPVPLMKGVEVIRGQLTSDDTRTAAFDFVRKLGKEPIRAMDFAGFIVSRLVNVLMNEAVKMVQEGNRPEDIDKAMQLCAGHPMGPCRLLDLVGAEIAMHGMETIERDFGEKYKPTPLLKRRVLAGLLGERTGKGFYNY